MENFESDHTPRDLKDTADLLREHRCDPSDVELDRLKLLVVRQASSKMGGFTPRPRGVFMKRKFLSGALVMGVLLSSTSVGLAVTGNFPGSDRAGSDSSSATASADRRNASAAQYGGTRVCQSVRRANRREERDLKRRNRSDERTLRRRNRAEERGVRGSVRRNAVRRNRSQERIQRKRNRGQERSQRRRNRAEERRCQRTGSP